MIKTIKTTFLLLLMQTLCMEAVANTDANPKQPKDSQQVYKLTYMEREPGTDEYEVTMLISDRYIRIDETDEKSGFIIYDDKKKVIYSVGHQDQSTLVINHFEFSEKNSPVKANVEYLQLADAPSVSGKNIYNYRIYIKKGKAVVDEEETCTEIQLVEGLLPEVRGILQNYQKVVSGQQVNMVDNKITEMQTGCFYVDQIYNSGAYYEKGLPIQEWHSNERFKILKTYEKISVEADIFKTPENYRQFSIDRDSKFSLQ